MAEFSTSRRAAFVAAPLTFINAALIARTIVKSKQEWDKVDGCGFEEFKALDTGCLTIAWEIDNQIRWLLFAINIIGAIVPFLYLPLILSYGDIFKKSLRSSGAHFMTLAFVAAAGIQILQAACEAGLHTTADWVDREFTLTPDHIVTLTLAYFVARSLFLWLFAMDLLFFGCGMMMFGYLTNASKELPKYFSVISGITGLISVINFGFELARFGNWGLFSTLSGFTTLAQFFVLAPIWLIIGACYLPRFSSVGRRESLMTDAPGEGGLELGALTGSGSGAGADGGDVARI